MPRNASVQLIFLLLLIALPGSALALGQPSIQRAPSVRPAIADPSTTLRWTTPPQATQVHLQVVPANNDGPGINMILNSTESFTIPAPPTWYVLLPGMTYSWRVRFSDSPTFAPEADPSWNAWSGPTTFRTAAPSSGGIRAVSPVDGFRPTEMQQLPLQ